MGNAQSSIGFAFPHVKPLVAVFFKHLPAETLADEILDANGNSAVFIENLINNHYDVFKHVTRVVYYGFLGNRARYGVYGDQLSIDLDDYVNIACLCVFDKLPDKLRLNSTPGEIVTCICLWMEQKIKRALCGEIDHEYCIKEIPESEIPESTDVSSELDEQIPSADLMESMESEEFSDTPDGCQWGDEMKPGSQYRDAGECRAYTTQVSRSMRIHSPSDEDVLAVIERLQHYTHPDSLYNSSTSIDNSRDRNKTTRSYLQRGKKTKSIGMLSVLKKRKN